MNKLVAAFFSLLIRGYQICISPFFPPSCRFYPTCSCYALKAIEMHGPWKGFFLATKRILRCNQYFKGGYDPVPEKNHKILGEKNG